MSEKLRIRASKILAVSGCIFRPPPPTSDLRLPTSDFRHPTSDLRLPTSGIRLPTSDLRLPTSGIRLPAPTSDFRLQASDFPTSDFRLPTSDFVIFCGMKKRKTVLQQVTVEDYAAEGKALTKLDGKVIFIEGAVPGDVVDVQLSKSKKNGAKEKPYIFTRLGPDRVTPFCDHFGVCGGCKWQMLPYEKQLQYKQNEVAQNLRRIGKVELPPIQPHNRLYRNSPLPQ